jgi:hypothetical protein
MKITGVKVGGHIYFRTGSENSEFEWWEPLVDVYTSTEQLLSYESNTDETVKFILNAEIPENDNFSAKWKFILMARLGICVNSKFGKLWNKFSDGIESILYIIVVMFIIYVIIKIIQIIKRK